MFRVVLLTLQLQMRPTDRRWPHENGCILARTDDVWILFVYTGWCMCSGNNRPELGSVFVLIIFTRQMRGDDDDDGSSLWRWRYEIVFVYGHSVPCLLLLVRISALFTFLFVLFWANNLYWWNQALARRRLKDIQVKQKNHWTIRSCPEYLLIVCPKIVADVSRWPTFDRIA